MTATERSTTSGAAAAGQVAEMGRVQRLARFVCVGGVGFVFSTAVLAVLVGQGLPNFLASLLATEAAIVLNYVGHEMFTFGTRQVTWRRLATYNLSAALGLVITAAAFDAISRGTDLPLVVRNLLAVGCGTASNFLISSRFVWGTKAGVVAPSVETGVNPTPPER